MVREKSQHVNKGTLPTVGPWLMVKVGNEFIRMRRERWATAYANVLVYFVDEEGKELGLPLETLEWRYP